jgi:proteasome lid subunit RPN8/RPN11
MSLRIGPGLLERIREYGRERYPHECCGFLLGRSRGGGRRVVRLRAAVNEHPDSPRNRYFIPPEEYLEAERIAEREGIEVVGFYHSHPDTPAAPSEFDRTHALPGVSYVIVSVRGGEPGEIRSFSLSPDQEHFQEETVKIVQGAAHRPGGGR